MKVKVTRRRVARTLVLIVIVVCVSRENVWDVAYKLLVVSLHSAWEFMDAPVPSLASLKPTALYQMAKDAVYELVK